MLDIIAQIITAAISPCCSTSGTWVGRGGGGGTSTDTYRCPRCGDTWTTPAR